MISTTKCDRTSLLHKAGPALVNGEVRLLHEEFKLGLYRGLVMSTHNISALNPDP